VEYYLKGPDSILTYPWDQWPKGQPLKIEMVEAYYEAERNGKTVTDHTTGSPPPAIT